MIFENERKSRFRDVISQRVCSIGNNRTIFHLPINRKMNERWWRQFS